MDKKRFNIYYSSPYFYLYDGDDTGELVYKADNEIDILKKQSEMEELHLSERNNG